MTDLDSRFWRSFRALMFRPGRLSRDYIDGRRAHWLAPITVFVLVNVVYFVAPALTDFSLPFNNQVPGELALASFEDPEALSPSARERFGSWTGQIHSPWTAPLVERRVEHRNLERLERSDGAVGYTVADYARAYDDRVGEISKVLVILHVPFLALALMALFWRHRLYYAEHFVVALHLFAAIVLFIEISFGPLSWIASTGLGGTGYMAALQIWRPVSLAVVLLYTALALRCVYQVRWFAALAAALLMLVVLAATSLFVYRTVQFLLIFAIT